jgi:hypothetical protein
MLFCSIFGFFHIHLLARLHNTENTKARHKESVTGSVDWWIDVSNCIGTPPTDIVEESRRLNRAGNTAESVEWGSQCNSMNYAP